MAGAVTASASGGDAKSVGETREDCDMEANAHGERNQNTLEGSNLASVSPDGPTGAAEDAAISSKQATQAGNEDKSAPEVLEPAALASSDSVTGSEAPLNANVETAEHCRVVVEGDALESGFLWDVISTAALVASWPEGLLAVLQPNIVLA